MGTMVWRPFIFRSSKLIFRILKPKNTRLFNNALLQLILGRRNCVVTRVTALLNTQWIPVAMLQKFRLLNAPSRGRTTIIETATTCLKTHRFKASNRRHAVQEWLMAFPLGSKQYNANLNSIWHSNLARPHPLMYLGGNNHNGSYPLQRACV